MVVLFILFALLATAAAMAVLYRIRKVDEQIDGVYEKLFHQEGLLSEHQARLDAHIKNITSNQKHIDEVDECLCNHVSKKDINNAYSKEDRAKAEGVIVENYGKKSLREIAKEIGISASTVGRWAKNLKQLGVIR